MTQDVRAALRALATDGCIAHDDPAAVVDEADAARDDVRVAATFVGDRGLDRLRAAIDRTDDPTTTRRGRRALDELERCRRVAADHVHSGRGTVLSPGDQRSER